MNSFRLGVLAAAFTPCVISSHENTVEQPLGPLEFSTIFDELVNVDDWQMSGKATILIERKGSTPDLNWSLKL